MNTMSAVAEKQILEKEIQQQSQQNKVFSFDRSFQEKIVQACLEYRDWETDRKSTRLNSSHLKLSRMPSSA